MYLDVEHEDGYYRDQSVFGDGISIEDTMGVIVKYRSGALLTYNFFSYAPWEGFQVNFNGSKGRLEATIVEQSYANSGGDQALEGAIADIKIAVDSTTISRSRSLGEDSQRYTYQEAMSISLH